MLCRQNLELSAHSRSIKNCSVVIKWPKARGGAIRRNGMAIPGIVLRIPQCVSGHYSKIRRFFFSDALREARVVTTLIPHHDSRRTAKGWDPWWSTKRLSPSGPYQHVRISRSDVMRQRWTTRLPAVVIWSLVAKNAKAAALKKSDRVECLMNGRTDHAIPCQASVRGPIHWPSKGGSEKNGKNRVLRSAVRSWENVPETVRQASHRSRYIGLTRKYHTSGFEFARIGRHSGDGRPVEDWIYGGESKGALGSGAAIQPNDEWAK